jgi:uncharacterized membrane protein YbhN (UPF0104 family)
MLERLRRVRTTRILAIVLSVAVVLLIATRWGEVTSGLRGAAFTVVGLAVALQVVALVSRSEAWLGCVRAAGGEVDRRRLYRASSLGCVGNLLNVQAGTAARIAALRRCEPVESPPVPALIAAELPIVFVEASLAALTSFTLVGPLGLPWWVPLACLAGVALVSAALRTAARARARWLSRGLAVMGTLRGRLRLLAFVLVAVFAQIARNWLMLHAVGVDASVFDAVAVLIAVVTLGQLPFGLGAGTAASVLILGPHGVAAAAAAGVLLTATGTLGGLGFAAWGILDGAAAAGRLRTLQQVLRRWTAWLRPRVVNHWSVLGALPLQRRQLIERSYFGGLSHGQITRVLGLSAA